MVLVSFPRLGPSTPLIITVLCSIVLLDLLSLVLALVMLDRLGLVLALVMLDLLGLVPGFCCWLLRVVDAILGFMWLVFPRWSFGPSAFL